MLSGDFNLKNKLDKNNNTLNCSNAKASKASSACIVSLPIGWKKTLCPTYFCKVCGRPIAYWGICSPSKRHYYHIDCIKNSRAFRKALRSN